MRSAHIVTKLSHTGWTEWQEITIRENWIEITPEDGYLFSVQTDIVGITTGIRFYLKHDHEYSDYDTFIIINIPANSGQTINYNSQQSFQIQLCSESNPLFAVSE